MGVQDGQFVGKSQDGTVLCNGTELLGASVEVVGRYHIGAPLSWILWPISMRIQISEMDAVSTWEFDPSKRRYVATYRLVGDNGNSICTKRKVAWMDNWQVTNLPQPPPPNQPPRTPTGAPPQPTTRQQMPPGIRGQLWFAETDHAVIVQGETYDDDGTISRSGAEWFNIGCAGNAIAKMRLLGFDPMASGQTPANRSSTPDERIATLKMLTAKYTGPVSHTVQGTKLLWMSSRGIVYYGDPLLDPGIGPIEAQWGPSGALCLSHLRLSRRPTITADVASVAASEHHTAADLRSSGQLPVCSTATQLEIRRSIANGSIGNAFWTTFTFDHVD